MNRAAEKKAVRKAALLRRRDLDASLRLEGSEKIAARLMRLARQFSWKIISCYIDFDTEVQTDSFLKNCFEEGLRVAVPYVDCESRRLYLSEIKNLDSELTINKYGIKEPKRQYLRLIPVGAFDAIIVPGSAFDPNGYRLGYGLGFYDRFLQDIQGKIPLIGLSFSSQIVEKLPVEEHDVPVDMVITEEKIYFSDRKKPASIEAVTIEEVL